MQGYGFYVWGSVLITLAILGGNFVYAYYKFKTVLKVARACPGATNNI